LLGTKGYVVVVVVWNHSTAEVWKTLLKTSVINSVTFLQYTANSLILAKKNIEILSSININNRELVIAN
jgi:hypothetical protein